MLDSIAERKQDKLVEKEYRERYAKMGQEVDPEALKRFVQKKRKQREASAAEEEEDVELIVPTGYIGHSSELSTYTRYYTDKVSSSNRIASNFYNRTFNYNPSASYDSLRYMRLDNKIFARLQPWAENGLVSKLDVGLGDRMLQYYTMDPTYLSSGTNTTWNSMYVYAGARGQYLDFVHWKAKGNYVVLGTEFSDLDVDADVGLNFYPFRKARKSPVSLDIHFETSLKEPDFYHQHMLTNHYKWDNDFKKTSTTKIQGQVNIPRWDMKATLGYALLANNIYFDTLGIVRQNVAPMSVLSATLDKNFQIGKLIHLDHRLLFQLSSNQEVLPLPTLAANLRYYAQLNIANGTMLMQLGIDGYWNTAWYSPAWNPAIGVFHNQNTYKYNNGPVFDAFANIQWKRACIFVKLENAGMGWPMEKADYFSAHNYIRTTRAVKVGIYWPFYIQPAPDKGSAARAAASGLQR